MLINPNGYRLVNGSMNFTFRAGKKTPETKEKRQPVFLDWLIYGEEGEERERGFGIFVRVNIWAEFSKFFN